MTRRFYCRTLPTLALFVAATWGQAPARAATIFVDNRIGSDGYDGRAPEPQGTGAGPVRSIQAGLNLCGEGDQLVVVNNGTPYYESLSLSGERHSGRRLRNFEIVGNGATVLGIRSVPPSAWKYVKDNVWSLHLHRKGHVLLLADGEIVPRFAPAGAQPQPGDLPVGQFLIHEGLVHYRGDADHRPPDMDFAFARDDVGITLYKVHDVTIRDLNLGYFRIDGVSAADSARRITLVNVTSYGNGRAGLTLKGSSTVTAVGGGTRANLEDAVRIESPAALGVDGFEFDVEPTVVD